MVSGGACPGARLRAELTVGSETSAVRRPAAIEKTYRQFIEWGITAGKAERPLPVGLKAKLNSWPDLNQVAQNRFWAAERVVSLDVV